MLSKGACTTFSERIEAHPEIMPGKRAFSRTADLAGRIPQSLLVLTVKGQARVSPTARPFLWIERRDAPTEGLLEGPVIVQGLKKELRRFHVDQMLALLDIGPCREDELSAGSEVIEG